MPCPGPPEDSCESSRVLPRDSHRVLWIGRVSDEKCPDRLFEIAKRCPGVVFDFVGPANAEYAEKVSHWAKSTPNVVVRGAIDREDLSDLYSEAAVLCSTSDSEGFPNTFLEAWSHGVPVVSKFDPDNLIDEKGLGVVANDVPGLSDAIHGLLGSPDRWHKASRVAREYYLKNHTSETVMPKFESLFVSVWNERASTAAAKGKPQ
jgi:glycosyltransferase involved in cell wall biosynthesis